MRNIINLHIVRDDSLLGALKFVSKTEDSQKYGALILDGMINQTIKDTEAFKTYYDFATGKKAKRVKRSAKKSTTTPVANVVNKDTPVAQVKEALRKSKKDSHMLHASSSGDEVGSHPKVPNEFEDKTESTDEGTGGDSQDDERNNDDSDDVNDADKIDEDDNGDSDDNVSKKTDPDDDENLNLNLKDNEEEETHEEEYVHTPTPDYGFSDDEEYEDLYGDVNITPKDTEPEKEEKGDAEMTDVGPKNVSQEQSHEQEIKDAHVTITQKMDSSSVSFGFINQLLNLDNIPPVDTEVSSTPSFNSSFPDCASLFGFDQRVSALESKMSEFTQTSQFANAFSSILGIVDQYLASKMKEEMDSEQAEELVFKTADSKTPQDQRGNMGNIEDQPNVEAASKHDWFKEPERPPTLDPDWNDRQLIDFRPPQRWISQIAKATKPPHLFDELMHTPINFSAFVMNHLMIENLTQ
ncbi:hypothetical protein Tco_1324171 [Tanacetum coccineum]